MAQDLELLVGLLQLALNGQLVSLVLLLHGVLGVSLMPLGVSLDGSESIIQQKAQIIEYSKKVTG